MKGKVIAVLETRTGEHLTELLSRRGAVPMWAPALEEIPDVDRGQIAALIERWSTEPFGLVVFQTGVGTRALFAVADELGLTEKLGALLQSARVVVRGPKPVGELTARRVRIDIRAASPFTTDTVLEALAGADLTGVRSLVQSYGAVNGRLREALEGRGATVEEITTYRWSLPRDTAPLRALLAALADHRIDATVFTSAVQVHHLYAVARAAGGESHLTADLRRTVIASIGPVCSAALSQYGLVPTLEASPPKLGPLLSALESAW